MQPVDLPKTRARAGQDRERRLRRRADAPQEARKGQGWPHRRSIPRSAVQFTSLAKRLSCRLFQATWVPETARVDESKVCALLTERGLDKDKRATAVRAAVQAFKGAQSQAKPSSSPCVRDLLF